MRMYNQIENILGRPLNIIETEKLDKLLQSNSINEIAECFKKYKDKHFNYVIEVLRNKPKRNNPEWLDREIINEPIDKETQQQFDDFQEWLVGFKNGK